MRLKAPTLVALAAVLVAVPTASARDTSADAPLVRMRDGHGSDLLFRVNPRTLQQVGRPIRTFRNGTGLSISPDGTRLAFADGAHPRHPRARRRTARIHFVDLAKWRSMGVARAGRHGWLTVGWAGRDRLVAIAGEGFGRQRLLWVDARTRTVVARRSYSGWTVNTLPIAGGLALVLGPHEGVGPIRILVLDPSGGVRTINVDGIEAGANYDERGQVLTPAIAVSPDGARLYAVAARGLLVAEVELATGAVSYHSLGASASKGNIAVWWRAAVWAGDGRIALTGDHWPRPRGRLPDGPIPFGVRVIDTRTWSIATLDPRPDTIHVAGETVLAAGTRYFDAGQRTESTGLLAFDVTGRRAWTRFRGRPVALLGSRGSLVYAWVRRKHTAYVLDRDSGRTLHTIRTGIRVPFLLSPP
jgi:WD40-like Beta Propeller Repeat